MCGLAAAILRVAILFLSMLRVRILARLILLALLRALLTIVRVLTVLLAGVFQLMSHDITLGDIGKSAGFQTTCKQRAKRVDVNLVVSARDICDEALHTSLGSRDRRSICFRSVCRALYGTPGRQNAR